MLHKGEPHLFRRGRGPLLTVSAGRWEKLLQKPLELSATGWPGNWDEGRGEKGNLAGSCAAAGGSEGATVAQNCCSPSWLSLPGFLGCAALT